FFGFSSFLSLSTGLLFSASAGAAAGFSAGFVSTAAGFSTGFCVVVGLASLFGAAFGVGPNRSSLGAADGGVAAGGTAAGGVAGAAGVDVPDFSVVPPNKSSAAFS